MDLGFHWSEWLRTNAKTTAERRMALAIKKRIIETLGNVAVKQHDGECGSQLVIVFILAPPVLFRSISNPKLL